MEEIHPYPGNRDFVRSRFSHNPRFHYNPGVFSEFEKWFGERYGNLESYHPDFIGEAVYLFEYETSAEFKKLSIEDDPW